ncbi:MAG: DinB family protein [Candidatus Nanopelagicales bacterium]
MNQDFTTKVFGYTTWANVQMFNTLLTLTDDQLQLTRPNSEWTVGAIAKHIVDAESMLIARLRSESPTRDRNPISSIAEIPELIEQTKQNGAALLELVTVPEAELTFGRETKVTFTASTILAQAAHHASEHRSQIADILAVNGNDVLDLDSIDVWSYERYLRNI